MTIELGHPPVAQVAEGAADGARMEADEIAKRQRMIPIAITDACLAISSTMPEDASLWSVHASRGYE
jgi:hypothetical protein